MISIDASGTAFRTRWLNEDNDLEIVPVLNKIDLPAAEPDRIKEQIEDVIGLDASDAVLISAKTGLNIEAVLEAIAPWAAMWLGVGLLLVLMHRGGVVLPMMALMSFCITPYQALMPIFAAEIFGGGASMLGFLVGAAGFGGLLAVAYLAARPRL